MRAFTCLFAGLALVLAACASADPPPAQPLPPSPPPVPTASAAPTVAAATTAVASAAPVASAAADAPVNASPVSPCPAGMALVPGGTFTMSRPRREVTVAALCMDVNETTADEYAACVKAGQCSTHNLKCSLQATYEAPGKGNHPMNCVDFEQAVTYCKGQNKRLASDEEWEWVARGGPAGHAFPWGDDKPSGKACWSGDALRLGTCTVGETPAGDSPQGIHDLAGNVFEWTTSRNDKSGPERVARGGSWREGTPAGIKASRPSPGFKVTYRCGFLGIRCVAEPAKP